MSTYPCSFSSTAPTSNNRMPGPLNTTYRSRINTILSVLFTLSSAVSPNRVYLESPPVLPNQTSFETLQVPPNVFERKPFPLEKLFFRYEQVPPNQTFLKSPPFLQLFQTSQVLQKRPYLKIQNFLIIPHPSLCSNFSKKSTVPQDSSQVSRFVRS